MGREGCDLSVKFTNCKNDHPSYSLKWSTLRNKEYLKKLPKQSDADTTTASVPNLCSSYKAPDEVVCIIFGQQIKKFKKIKKFSKWKFS